MLVCLCLFVVCYFLFPPPPKFASRLIGDATPSPGGVHGSVRTPARSVGWDGSDRGGEEVKETVAPATSIQTEAASILNRSSAAGEEASYVDPRIKAPTVFKKTE